MNGLNKVAIASVMILAGAGAAFAQTTANTTGSTTILRPLTITKDADLAFGRVVRPTSGTSTVAIADTADTVSVGGTGLSAGGTTSRAAYTIDGEGAQVVSLTIPADFTMTHTNTVDELEVTLDPSATGTTTLDGTIGGDGTAGLFIGGSFDVTTTTVSGAYSGTFNVDVAYQ